MTTQFLDFKELLSWILKEHQHPELFAFMVWSIWNQRKQTRVYQPSCNLSWKGLLIEDVRRSSLFNQLHYSYVKSEGNKVAHSLVMYDVHISDFHVWMKDVSPQFISVVQADL